MFKKVLSASLVGLAVASAAQAGTINFQVSQNDDGTGVPTPGSFAIYGTTFDSGVQPSFGLVSFAFQTNGDLTTTNRSPNATFTDPNEVGPTRTAGFTVLRRNGNEADASGDTSGGQNTTDANAIIYYGIGQTSGDLRTQRPAGYAGGNANNGIGSIYASPVLLAVGTFVPGVPGSQVVTLSDLTGGVLISQSNFSNAAASTYSSTFRDLVPEPASLALLGVAGVGMIARRRKA